MCPPSPPTHKYRCGERRGRAQSPNTPGQTPVQIGGFHCTAQRHFNFENPWSTGGQEPVWSGLFHSFEKGRLVGFLPASLEQSLRHWLFKSINQRKLGGGSCPWSRLCTFLKKRERGRGGRALTRHYLLLLNVSIVLDCVSCFRCSFASFCSRII